MCSSDLGDDPGVEDVAGDGEGDEEGDPDEVLGADEAEPAGQGALSHASLIVARAFGAGLLKRKRESGSFWTGAAKREWEAPGRSWAKVALKTNGL